MNHFKRLKKQKNRKEVIQPSSSISQLLQPSYHILLFQCHLPFCLFLESLHRPCMDQYSRPQGSFNTPNSGYTYHLIYNPIRTYRDVVTQTYNTQSAEDHNKYTGRTAANTNSHQHERHHNSKGNDEHLEPGDRYGNRHGYDFDNDRMDLEFTNTQSNQTGYEENRHGHNANTSLSSAGTGAGTDSQGSKSNIGEEASINMLTLPTINERICIRWAAQKGWEPYM